MPEQPTVLIMAAGLGTRMRSSLPKVLHPVCGRPMVHWVIEAAREAGAGRVVCITRPGDGVAEGLPDGVEVAVQSEGEGTGAAVLAAREMLEPDATVVVLSGDHPLVSRDLIAQLLAAHAKGGAAATLVTTDQLEPASYGRIVRAGDGGVERIVETKDSERVEEGELAIREVNVGTYAFDAGELLAALDEVELRDGERYLTAVLPILRERGGTLAASLTTDTTAAMGVNSRVELMEAEHLAQQRILARLAAEGAHFAHPGSACVEAGVEIGEDTRIGPGVTLRGETSIGSGCDIGPNTSIADSSIGDGAAIVQSHLVECEVHAKASVGPFAYLRPGTVVREGAKIGTFVETKNADVGEGAKVPHLSYLGDADVGEGANVAAGNITANYDGREKHRTKIGKGARTGVDTAFVAPVSVGDGAYTGAGSVITEDVPDGALGISRPEQKNVEGYAERVKKESDE